jgi:hypothetical protein
LGFKNQNNQSIYQNLDRNTLHPANTQQYQYVNENQQNINKYNGGVFGNTPNKRQVVYY